VHEAPYIRSDNDQELEPGMVFTIEPGIYMPGVGGVRIEDDVAITQGGIEVLSTAGRGLADISSDTARSHVSDPVSRTASRSASIQSWVSVSPSSGSPSSPGSPSSRLCASAPLLLLRS